MDKDNKKKPKKCKDLSFDECELSILRMSISEAKKENAQKELTDSPNIRNIITTVENFIKDKKKKK
jgi:hypothetical protein